MAVRIDADADKVFRSTNLPSSNNISVFMFAKLNSSTAGFNAFFSLDNGSDYQVLETDGSPLFVLNVFESTGNVAGVHMVVGNWYAIGYSSDGVTLRLYVKDLTAATASVEYTGAARAAAATATTMYIGGDGFAENTSADIRSAMIWRTAYSKAQFDAQSVSLMPVDTTNIDSWFTFADNGATAMTDDQTINNRDMTRGAGSWTTETDPPVGGSTYTVSADAGVYTVTGQSVGLFWSHKLAAVNGAWAITGTPALLIPMGGSSGVSALDQEDSFEILLESGDLILKEQPPNQGYIDQEQGDEILLEDGTFFLKESGTAGNVLVADAGVYVVTGTTAALKRALKVAADAGAVAITGTAASLEYNRAVAGTAGSYVVTGTAANFLRGLKVAAVSGSYAIAGTNASLEKSTVMSGVAGSYAITGTAAALRKGINLSADAGVVAISGTTASLEYNRAVGAVAGSYAITGTNASLKKATRLTADPGAVLITGTSASLRKGVALVAAPGSYAITGTTASLKYNRTVGAVAGSYAVAGTAASLRVAARMLANAGVVLIAGTDADLRVSGNFVADPGSYVVTGSVAALRRTVLLGAVAGSYAVTGTAAALRKMFRVAADPGAVVINGTPATFKKAIRMLADAGVVVVTGTAATFHVSGPIAAPGSYAVTGSNVNLLRTSSTPVAPPNSGTAQVLGGRIAYQPKSYSTWTPSEGQ